MKTMEQLAQDLRQDFERRERDNGEGFYCLPDVEHPAKPMVYEAHDGEWANDFVYEAIVDTLDNIAGGAGEDDCAPAADVYHSRLLDWVGENLYRMAYVDEAMKEWGAKTLSEALIWGQARQLEHIARTVWNYLEEACNSQPLSMEGA
jgi:hypothetical protein